MKYVFAVFLTMIWVNSNSQVFDIGLAYQQLNYKSTSIVSYQLASDEGEKIIIDEMNDQIGMIGPYIGNYLQLFGFDRRNKISLGLSSQARFVIWIDTQKDEREISSNVYEIYDAGDGASTEMQLLILPAIRYGKISAGVNSKFDIGASFEFGVRFNTFSYKIMNLPYNEKGTSLSPLARFVFAYKNTEFGINYAFNSYQTYYKGNVDDIPRVKFDNQLGFSIGFIF